MRSPRLVLVALALVAAALAVPAVAGKEKAAPKLSRGFDHAAHAENAGKLKCDGACHKAKSNGDWVQNGKTEHSRCFEGCHKFTTSCGGLKSGVGRVCVTCHVNLKGKCLPDDAKPLPRHPEFAASYSHKKHIAPGAKTGRQCEGCHGKFGDDSPRTGRGIAIGHSQCSSCHERGMEPLMNQCNECHTAGATATGAPGPRPPNPYAVTGAFDHQKHANERRVGTTGKACLTCHGNIAKADDDTSIPLPTMLSCYQSCHDGKTAFSAVGATCTRCHQGGRK